MTNLIEVQEINKVYNNDNILKDISFNIKPGMIVGFIGANGAGKSTTFKTILGLSTANSGTTKFFDNQDLSSNKYLKNLIGVVFDATNIPTELNILQINKVMKNMYNLWDEKEFYNLINAYKLPIKKKIGTFSRGMNMKLSIAIALSHNAKLLLLDEATGGLDPQSRLLVLNKIKNYVIEKEAGVILSSHIIDDIEKIANYIMIINSGKIVLKDSKKNILSKYALVETDSLDNVEKDIIVSSTKKNSHYELIVSDKKMLTDNIKTSEISLGVLSEKLTGCEYL